MIKASYISTRKCALDDMAFWLAMDMKPQYTYHNHSWIPNYPIWTKEIRSKGDIRLLHTFYTPNIMKQLEVAHELHKLKKIWSKTEVHRLFLHGHVTREQLPYGYKHWR